MICPLREEMLVKGPQLQKMACTNLLSDTFVLIPFSSSEVPQANMFTQAHDFEINDGVFHNIASNQLI